MLKKCVRLVLLHISDNWNIWTDAAEFDTDTLITEIGSVFGVDINQVRLEVSSYLSRFGVIYNDPFITAEEEDEESSTSQSA